MRPVRNRDRARELHESWFALLPAVPAAAVTRCARLTRSASLLPLGIMITAMLLAWFVPTWVGMVTLVVPWGIGRLAVSGQGGRANVGFASCKDNDNRMLTRLGIAENCAHLVARTTSNMCCLERQKPWWMRCFAYSHIRAYRPNCQDFVPLCHGYQHLDQSR